MSDSRFRIVPNTVRLSADFLRKFQSVTTSQMSDCMNRLNNTICDIRPYHNLTKLVGTALTVKVPPGHNLMARNAFTACRRKYASSAKPITTISKNPRKAISTLRLGLNGSSGVSSARSTAPRPHSRASCQRPTSGRFTQGNSSMLASARYSVVGSMDLRASSHPRNGLRLAGARKTRPRVISTTS